MNGAVCPNPSVLAVLWDFGGVFTESPFKAFAGFERGRGLPEGFLRRVNSVNGHDNAWARFERGQIDLPQFGAAFELESKALGHPVRGEEVIALLYGDVRPTMVGALRRCKAYFRNACLTNNVKTSGGHGLPTSEARAREVTQILSLFDLVVESTLVGARKPEPRFYQIALERLAIEPGQAVYLDDLGMNLKPARALGMTTIKVDSAAQALGELEAILRIPLLDQ